MTKLNDIQGKSPFKVPDNYFSEVNKKILSLTTDSEVKVLRVSFYNRFRTSLLIAASVAGFILIGFAAVKLLAPENRNIQVSEVLHQISPDSIVNEIDLSMLEEDASSVIIPDEVPDVSKKDIIDYLIQNDIDLNDIYEHL